MKVVDLAENRNARKRAWNAANPEKLREINSRQRERIRNDPELQERERDHKAKYRARTREARRAYANAYRAANLERARERSRANGKLVQSDPQRKQQRKNYLAEYFTRSQVRAARRKTNRRASLKFYYAITPEKYEAMLAAQDGHCALCAATPEQQKHRYKRLHVDHDHITGDVRALLCSGCNLAIGNFGDDPARLRAAADYIDRHRRGHLKCA
jgi:hypothetical protein